MLTGFPPEESVSADISVVAAGLFNISWKFAPAHAAPVLAAAAGPDVRIAEFSWICLTLEPNRPNVYAPTTSAKTRVPAIRMIVAMTGVTPFLLFLNRR